MHYALRLDHRVQRKRGAAFTLAPAAMTAMHDKWWRLHAIAHPSACTAAVEREAIAASHVLQPGRLMRPANGKEQLPMFA